MSQQALTTKSRIKNRLGITATNFDTLLDDLILAVSARIEQMCNRHFMQAMYTQELYDGSDVYDTYRKILLIKNAPILSLSAVEYKGGLNSNPTWYAYTADDYDVDYDAGILYFFSALPRGKRNIRITYTGGFTGFSIGVNNYWIYNATPSGTVNGANATFTLPVAASQVIVYADGIRVAAANLSFTANTNTFTFLNGSQPYSSISVDYLPTAATPDTADDIALPSDLVEVCEEAVVRLFKRRDSEGRSSETFNESTVTWSKDVFNPENLATIKNYRRASFV